MSESVLARDSEAVFDATTFFIERHLLEGRGSKVAIRTPTGTVTYAELASYVNQCGCALRCLGLRPGQRILLIIKDCPDFFYLFWGALKVGLIPVPLNTMLRADDLSFIIEHSECSAIVWSAMFAAEVERALFMASAKPRVALPMDGCGRTLAASMTRESSFLEPCPATADSPGFWLYTSGSTGRPKAAVHLLRNMIATCTLYARKVIDIRENDICFSIARLFFAYGLGNAMLFPLSVGATAVLVEEKPTARGSFDIIECFRPTLFFGVPTLYAAQLQSLQTRRVDFSSVRLCISAGEALPAEMYHQWKERTGLKILDGIGSTEALHIFISNQPDDVCPGTSGRLVPGYQARILSESGVEVAPGEVGRLQISGPSTAPYYWNAPDKTAETMRGEWLETGDFYRITAGGYYQYCGRADDMLKVGGIWCSPIEIESQLVRHQDVIEAAVTGAMDASGLVKPVAWVVLRDGVAINDTLRRELVLLCKQRLASYMYPREIHFVAALPKTATDKVQRYKLRGDNARNVGASSDTLL